MKPSKLIVYAVASCFLSASASATTVNTWWNATGTFTNKSISGSTNTFTNVPNSAMVNSSVTVGGKTVSLGGSITLASTNLSDYGSIPSAALATPYLTINGTQISLGGSGTISSTAGGTKGLTSGSYPSAGYVGEIKDTGVSSTVSLASSTGLSTSITSLSLTAGNWVCSGSVTLTGSSVTTYVTGGSWGGGISTSSTGGTSSLDFFSVTPPIVTTTSISMSQPTPNYILTTSSTTTLYLVGIVHYSAGSATANGRLICRRMS